jgi:radical SAM superfamily enzyme YgiQ (UPF0313 family)
MREDKIILINPSYDYPVTKGKKVFRWNRIWPPLDLANSASLLERQGFDATIIDANADRLTPKEVAQKTKEFDKIFITSASLDRWQCPHIDIRTFLETVEAIKEVKDDGIYVMGPHGTFRPKDILKITKVSGIIVGEPELTILDICENKDLKKIQGLYFIKNRRTFFRKRIKLLDLNSLPVPSFNLLPMEKYSYEILGDHFTLFEASRSCPYSCTFCAADQMYGESYRIKNAEHLVKEIEHAIENFGVKTAYFIDLEFTLNNRLNRENVKKLCNLLIKKKLDFKWCCQTRADSVDYNILKKMKLAGCELIHFGVETGSERILKSINKRLTLSQIENAIELTKKLGIKSVCFFMFGLPDETVEDMMKTIRFAKKISPSYASFNIATPYPNTVFYENVKGELTELFPAYYDGVFKVEDLKKVTNHALIQFYLRPLYLIRRVVSEDPRYLKRQFELFMNFLK